jgi:hypothetical protein
MKNGAYLNGVPIEEKASLRVSSGSKRLAEIRSWRELGAPVEEGFES